MVRPGAQLCLSLLSAPLSKFDRAKFDRAKFDRSKFDKAFPIGRTVYRKTPMRASIFSIAWRQFFLFHGFGARRKNVEKAGKLTGLFLPLKGGFKTWKQLSLE